jgi:flavin reductase (DIM6/NTAB) family NADH-FMN oxidoreductase RutF
MITPVDLKLAYRLINHGPTTLITSAHNGKQNIMAAAWVCALDFAPPKLTVVIDKNTYTRSLIEASGTFAVNLPCVSQAEMVRAVGTSTGKDLIDADKFSRYQISTFNAAKITAPLVEGCVAWLECKVIPHADIQSTYDLFLAEVVAAYADDRVFSNGHWHFEDKNHLRTLHHIAGGSFFTTGESISTKG